MKNTKIVWDLSELYSGPGDLRLYEDLVKAKKNAIAFSKALRGKINNLSAVKLLKAFMEFEAILGRGVKPQLYASLLFSTDTSNQKYGALLQKTQEVFVEISKQLMFFELEIALIDDKKLAKLAGDPVLKNYSHFLTRQIEIKKHRLSEAEERILADKEQTSKAAFTRLFEQIIGSKKFTLKNNRTTITLSEPQILDLLHDPDRETRKNAARDFTAGLKEEVSKLSYIYNTLAFDKKINDGYRKFEMPESSRHLDNEVDKRDVDAMVEAVRRNYNIVSKYYKFKSKVLKLGKLYDYDRYAPVKGANGEFKFAKARAIIKDAFGSFDKQFADISEMFFENNWIHASLSEGKRGGAYCSYLTPDLHPFVFVNYQNKIADVETLAHELGHGIHGYLMRTQTLLNFDSPLTLAETASVFAEMIVFDHLKQKLPPKENLALLMRMVEGLIASVFRQVSMFLFERDFHNERLKGEVPIERINELWINRQQEMFKGSVVLSDDYSYWWSYIPHFMETPFYVYAYSFGQLLTLSLYNRYKNQPEFPVKYKKFLSSGNSNSPKNLLSDLGVNTSAPEFWQEGLNAINSLVIEAEEAYRQIR